MNDVLKEYTQTQRLWSACHRFPQILCDEVYVYEVYSTLVIIFSYTKTKANQIPCILFWFIFKLELDNTSVLYNFNRIPRPSWASCQRLLMSHITSYWTSLPLECLSAISAIRCRLDLTRSKGPWQTNQSTTKTFWWLLLVCCVTENDKYKKIHQQHFLAIFGVLLSNF